MSTNERTGKRDLTYSAWHRAGNLAKHLEPVFAHIADHRARTRAALVAASRCTMIDVDGVEYCSACSTPLALIELKHEKASTKTTTVLEHLGELALLPVYLVEYFTDVDGAISGYRVALRYPEHEAPGLMTPNDYARFVLGIHEEPHTCTAQRSVA